MDRPNQPKDPQAYRIGFWSLIRRSQALIVTSLARGVVGLWFWWFTFNDQTDSLILLPELTCHSDKELLLFFAMGLILFNTLGVEWMLGASIPGLAAWVDDANYQDGCPTLECHPRRVRPSFACLLFFNFFMTGLSNLTRKTRCRGNILIDLSFIMLSLGTQYWRRGRHS